jgi:hypothetical protein
MLDVSRDRVPTRETLARLVDLLALVRMNRLQLYTEHTFAYRDHEVVWRDASPITADDVRWLDALCRERGIELVANQQSFGHMERWLRHAPYRDLAEKPEGFTLPDGSRREPMCLAPTEASLAFVRGLHGELLPNFARRELNIGCDETFELGQGRSREACEHLGRGRVYWDFVSKLVRGLHEQGVAVQFWGDIVERHAELVPELPRRNLAALLWNYEAPGDPTSVPDEVMAVIRGFGYGLESFRGFAARVPPFVRHGVAFHVCPGTSSWLSLVGRLTNALANVRDAAEVGLASGARGFLLTDWGDQGHLQPFPVSLPALVYGGALAWGVAANRDLDLEDALSRLVFRDATGEVARALVELGGLYRETGLSTLNASPLFLALLGGGTSPIRAWGTTSAAALEGVHQTLGRASERLSRARPQIDDGDLVRRELAQAARLARQGAWRLERAYLDGGPAPDALRRDLEECIEEQRAVWLARSRPGGLPDSLARLERVLG